MEQAFQAKMDISLDKAEHLGSKSSTCGRGRGGFEGRGRGKRRGRSRGRSYASQENFTKQDGNRFSHVHCHSCKKYGPIKI